MSRPAELRVEFRRQPMPLEQERPNAGGRKPIEPVLGAGRAGNGQVVVARGEGATGIAGTEDQNAGRHAAAPWAEEIRSRSPSRHSAQTSASASVRSRSAASAANRPAGINLDSAHTAAPRTRAEPSDASASTGATSDVSPELPAAIRTLRKNRSRPMRLTGEPANSCRKPPSSKARSAASGGAVRSARAASLSSPAVRANLFHG